jgi:hypothetical protein
VHQYYVEHHRTGAWTDLGTDAATLRLRLRDIDDVGAPATGTLRLNAASGTLVVPIDRDKYYKHFRLRIIANQQCPDSFYKIGSMVMGAVLPFGQQWGRGWTQTMIPNVSTRRSRYGSDRVTERGPPIREWSFAWADQPVDLYTLRNSIVPDYLGPTGATSPDRVTPSRDVWWMLWGILEQIRSGELPVVALNKIPDSGMVLDRTLFNMGTLTSAGRITHMLGSEGTSELVRVEPITVRGQPVGGDD